MKNSTFDYKGHHCDVQFLEGFAYFYVDGKFAFRRKHPQPMTPEQYVQEFIDNKYRS